MADQARRLSLMTKEERKQATCECYARMFDSPEAMEVHDIHLISATLLTSVVRGCRFESQTWRILMVIYTLNLLADL